MVRLQWATCLILFYVYVGTAPPSLDTRQYEYSSIIVVVLIVPEVPYSGFPVRYCYRVMYVIGMKYAYFIEIKYMYLIGIKYMYLIGIKYMYLIGGRIPPESIEGTVPDILHMNSALLLYYGTVQRATPCYHSVLLCMHAHQRKRSNHGGGHIAFIAIDPLGLPLANPPP